MAPDITDVTDEETFESALTTLIQTAHTNGVTVNGGWEANGNSDIPVWDVVVTPVERDD